MLGDWVSGGTWEGYMRLPLASRMTVTWAPDGLVVVSSLTGIGSEVSEVVAASGCVSKAVAIVL